MGWGVVHQLTAAPPIALDAPLSLPHLGVQIRPPAQWTIRKLDFDHLVAQGNDWQVTSREAGLVAVFSERSTSPASLPFHATITVAVRQLPPTASFREQSTAADYAKQLLSSIEGAMTRIGHIQRVTVNGLSGSRARYTYTQAYGDQILDLSTSVAALIDRAHARCFLFTVTSPTDRFRFCDRVFWSVVKSFHQDAGGPTT